MSDNAPTSNDAQPQNAANAERPPVPAQPAADAASAPAPQAAPDQPTPPAQQAAPAQPTPPQAAHQTAQAAQTGHGAQAAHAAHGAPNAFGAYAGQQPYTPPQANPTQPTTPYGAPGYAAPAYGAHAYGTTPYGAATATATEPQPVGAATGAPPTPGAKVGAGKIVGIMVAAALVGGAAGIGGAAAGASIFPQSQTVVTATPQNVTVNNTDSVNQTTAIAAKVVPSVVTISATSGSSGGTGSGVILTADGYVVTNTHVVTLDGETADAKLTVTTSDGKVYQATVVGTDPTYDLAVIKLEDASGLTPITFGDSSKLNVGDQTVAVGAPLGLSNTVTTGIVSALNRSIQIASSAAPDSGDQQEQSPGQGEGDSPFQFDFGQGQQQSATGSISIAVVQTDAAINPGNSGGALVNSAGELVGINVAIASAGGSSSSGQSGSIGVGFSIPSTIVKRISDELIADGTATHGLLGAMVGNAADQDGATTSGAYISEATAGGAAASAGLKKGDVVTSFNGFPITDATDLTAQVRALAAGSTADIVYIRDGKTATAKVTLGTLTQ
ncbi:MAG: trypsin-like peptidase domain-containing protein [Microbacterium sp.]|uniref:S1C family serine protease n=1 Tax=Microbacterium sp. TaxID=51671 RepID=UPI001AC02846|nr:trypsin-like peptidase domain-containing protein [Microbacterium sp.]MBN9176028.1 trypsin-like peptidase domain-containing protein [Microbacterium sp.]